MAGKDTIRSKEEKLAIIKRNLAGEASCALERETGCSHQLIQEWIKKYMEKGEAGLEVKKKTGNPLSRYERRKELTYEKQLQYKNVIQSMSRAGNPHDNAVMESFWGRFKDTLRKHFRCWESAT